MLLWLLLLLKERKKFLTKNQRAIINAPILKGIKQQHFSKARLIVFCYLYKRDKRVGINKSEKEGRKEERRK